MKDSNTTINQRKHLLECAVWEITLKCNLNCLHCGSSAGQERKTELDTDQALRICSDLKDAGCLSVALMGGEPFMRRDFWDIAARIRELGMDLSVITNGTIFEEYFFEKLKSLWPKAVAVSIDGAKKETHDKIRGVNGCYEKSWRFINLALKSDLPVSVITTVSKLNIGELKEISQQLLDKKIAWQIQTAGSEGERFPSECLLDREEFYGVGVFIDWLRRRYSPDRLAVIGAHDLGYYSFLLNDLSIYGQWPGCQAGRSVIGIRSNGDVLPCLSINNDKFICGNVVKTPIKQLWNDDAVFQAFRNFKKKDAGENCSSCDKIEECMGGCCEMSLMKTGKIRNDFFYCFRSIEKENFRSLLGRLRLKSLERAKNVFLGTTRLREIFLGKR